MNRMPAGDELLLFTGSPATEWNEHWVAIDVPAARKIFNSALDAMTGLISPPDLILTG